MCFECQRGWGWRGPRRRLWENGGLERQKYLSVKIVDKANDKRERRQNKRAIFPDVLQFDILRDFGSGPKDPLVFFSSPSLHDYVTCHLPKITNCQTAGCAYVIEFEGDQLNHWGKNEKKKRKKSPTHQSAQSKGAEERSWSTFFTIHFI